MRQGRKIDIAAVLPLILDNIRLGMPFKYACHQQMVSEKTFERWRKKDVINDQVKKAESDFIQRGLAVIEKAAKEGSWQAMAWKLERRYHDEFALKVKTEHSGSIAVEDRINKWLKDRDAEFAGNSETKA